MIFRSYRHFLGIFLNRKKKNNSRGAGAGFWPKATVRGRSGPLASWSTFEAARPEAKTAWPGSRTSRRGARAVSRLPVALRHSGVDQDPSAEHRGINGVPPGRLRRGGTHRLSAVTARWSGGSVRRRTTVSPPEKGSAVTSVRSGSCGDGRER
jgi:hypothetical protein